MKLFQHVPSLSLPIRLSAPLAAVLAITGCGGHNDTYSATVVGGPTPDFSMTVTPSSQSVTQGETASYSVILYSINGFSANTQLSVTGLPSEATGSFSFTDVNPTASGFTSTLTIDTTAPGGEDVSHRQGSGTPTGSFTFTVTGQSGTLTHSQTATLVVNQETSPVPGPAAALPMLVGFGATVRRRLTKRR